MTIRPSILMKVIEVDSGPHSLAQRLARIENLLEELRDSLSPSLGKRFIQAAVAGFGSLFGATVLVLILGAILQPFTRLEVFGDKIDRLIQVMEKDHKR